MRLTFLGAAQTVTGSCYLVETLQAAFLIDCGMFQGSAKEDHPNGARLPFRLRDLDFMLLTHAHIDHSGRIPKLWKDGFRAPIHATKATVELCGLMLPDSGHIQEMDHGWRNRKNARAGKPEEPPLYTSADATASLRLFRQERYDQPFTPAPGITVTFRDAGHILGSAIIELLVEENGDTVKVVFSGDLGNTGIPLMRDPTFIEGADLVVMETTYGDRLHDRTVDKADKFVTIVNETIRAGGNVVIPSFAVGRTQEVLYEINRQIAIENGATAGASGSGRRQARKLFLNTPVVVDSPLAVSATEVFRANEDCFDDEAQAYIANRDNPLDFPNLTLARSLDESKAINEDTRPKIIIASSGMCDAGRIRHHLKHNLWRPESTVLFVGYQAPGTLGRELVEGEKQVRLFGEEVTVCAKVESIEAFSGHADRDGLLGWLDAMACKPKGLILVHGEPDSMEAFAATVLKQFGLSAQMPDFGESIVFGADVPERVSPPEEAAPEAAQEALPGMVGAIRPAHGKPGGHPGPEGDRRRTPRPYEGEERRGRRHERWTAQARPGILPQLDALQADFLEVMGRFRERIHQAESRRERERTVARAREWEHDVRRTLERWNRK